MKNNIEHIHINPEFIESDFTEFASFYDIYLVRFMMHYKNYHFGDFNFTMDPEKIVEIEKDFIKTTLDLLKKRKKEFDNLQEKIWDQFLEENTMTVAELTEKWDDGWGKKIGEYENKRNSQEWSGSTSFSMNIHFLLLKANKIGCVIDLKEDFKFDEPVDFKTEQEEIFTKISGPEKLVYLKELGIIEFLEKKYPDISQTKMARVLSIIMGENDIRPTYQAMESDHFRNNPKNPYNNKKTVPRVKNHLIQWGFKIDPKENK